MRPATSIACGCLEISEFAHDRPLLLLGSRANNTVPRAFLRLKTGRCACSTTRCSPVSVICAFAQLSKRDKPHVCEMPRPGKGSNTGPPLDLFSNCLTRPQVRWALRVGSRPIPSGRPAGQAQSSQQEKRVSTDRVEWVNAAQTEAEIEALRKCVNRGTPYDMETWKPQIAATLGLKPTLQSSGRPRKQLELTSTQTGKRFASFPPIRKSPGPNCAPCVTGRRSRTRSCEVEFKSACAG
jgi:hypothetical protein